jgi:hypothetical protein
LQGKNRIERIVMNYRAILFSVCLLTSILGVTTGDHCDAGNGCEIDCEFGCGALISHEEGDAEHGTCYTFCADENGNEVPGSGQEYDLGRSRGVVNMLEGNVNGSLHNVTLPRLALAINQSSALKANYNEAQTNATITEDFNNTTLIELINSTGLVLVE